MPDANVHGGGCFVGSGIADEEGCEAVGESEDFVGSVILRRALDGRAECGCGCRVKGGAFLL